MNSEILIYTALGIALLFMFWRVSRKMGAAAIYPDRKTRQAAERAEIRLIQLKSSNDNSLNRIREIESLMKDVISEILQRPLRGSSDEISKKFRSKEPAQFFKRLEELQNLDRDISPEEVNSIINYAVNLIVLGRRMLTLKKR